MHRSKLFLTALLVALSACTEIAPEAADSPLGPDVQMSQSDAGATAAPVLSVSTTCQSFRDELEDVNEQMSATPASAELQEKQEALAAIVADVCN